MIRMEAPACDGPEPVAIGLEAQGMKFVSLKGSTWISRGLVRILVPMFESVLLTFVMTVQIHVLF